MGHHLITKADFLRDIFDAIPASVFIVDSDVRIFNVNAAAARMLSMDKDAFILKKSGEVLHCVNADNAGGCGGSAHCANCVIRHSVYEASQGRGVFRQTSSLRVHREDKIEEAHFMISASSVFHAGEGFILLTLEDVTELKNAERELEHTATKLHTITSVLGEGVYVLDAEGRLTFMNPEAERLLGWTEEELLGKNIHEVIHYQKADGAPLPASECPVLRTIDSNACYRIAEDIFTHKDGTMIPVSFVATPISRKGKVTGSVAAFHDITGRKKAQEELKRANELLEHRATTDTLTGIFNRLKFDDLMESELERVVRHASPLSLIMFDIDHFKKVNDTYGHHVGDKVLKEVTRIVTGELRKYDSFARWGGEEFIILSPYSNLGNALHLAERLQKGISEHPIDLVGRITCSFGVAEFSAGDDSDSLLRRVDKALYKAKNSGRNRIETA